MLLCLNELVPQVVDGGVVILDDYYTWDGCPRAVHEYLASRDLPYKIRRLGGGAFLSNPARSQHCKDRASLRGLSRRSRGCTVTSDLSQ